MRRWTTIAAGIGLAVACASSAAMPARDIPENLWLSAVISVDASGHITALDWDTLPPLQAMIAQGLTDKVRAWEFVPATLNGQPTWTRTGLTVRVHTQQDAAQNLSVQVDRVITGAMAGYGTVPPEYPLDAMREGASARIETEVTIAADGKIDIKRMDYEGNNQFYRKRFLSAAKQAMQRWTYHPEVVAGHAVPTPISIPMCWCCARC